MRVEAGDVLAVGIFCAIVLGVFVVGERLAALSSWLGDVGQSAAVDSTLGWLPIGGLLFAGGVLLALAARGLSRGMRLACGVVAVAWLVPASAYLWTPFGSSRGTFRAQVERGGEAFGDGVLAGELALVASAVLIMLIAVAQVVSSRWQPGNPENERRSRLGSAGALAGPSLVALLATVAA